MWTWSWASGGWQLSFLACNLLWPCSLIETSDEISGIHQQFTRLSHKASENQTFILKQVFLSSVCVLMSLKGNQAVSYKNLYKSILIRTYKKIANFIGYCT